MTEDREIAEGHPALFRRGGKTDRPLNGKGREGGRIDDSKAKRGTLFLRKPPELGRGHATPYAPILEKHGPVDDVI